MLGRLDTSTVLHRRSLVAKYPLWRKRTRDLYAHDFFYFHQFIEGGEKWVATLQTTMHYNCETNGQTPESILRMRQDEQPAAWALVNQEVRTPRADAAPVPVSVA